MTSTGQKNETVSNNPGAEKEKKTPKYIRASFGYRLKRKFKIIVFFPRSLWRWYRGKPLLPEDEIKDVAGPKVELTEAQRSAEQQRMIAADNLERVTRLIGMLYENYDSLSKNTDMDITIRIKRVDSSLKQSTAFFGQYDEELKHAVGPTGAPAIEDLNAIKKKFETLRESLKQEYLQLQKSGQLKRPAAQPVRKPAPPVKKPSQTAAPRVITPIPIRKVYSNTYLGRIIEVFAKRNPDFRTKWNRNKKYVYDKVLKGRNLEDEITLEKYAPANEVLQSAVDLIKPHPLVVQSFPTVYVYQMPKQGQMHFTLHFAHDVLFGNWQSGQFHQNEIQMVEHAALGYLGDYLHSQQPETMQLNDGSTLLLLGVKRYAKIDASKIYGEKFVTADHAILDASIEFIKRPIPGNILINEPLKVPEGEKGKAYTKEEIQKILVRLYTGFAAARQAAGIQHLVINTGNWGCGSYKNNHKMIAILQIFAALLAKVNELNAFTVTPEENALFLEGKSEIEKILSKYKPDGYVDVECVIAEVFSLRLPWQAEK